MVKTPSVNQPQDLMTHVLQFTLIKGKPDYGSPDLVSIGLRITRLGVA